MLKDVSILVLKGKGVCSLLGAECRWTLRQQNSGAVLWINRVGDAPGDGYDEAVRWGNGAGVLA